MRARAHVHVFFLTLIYTALITREFAEISRCKGAEELGGLATTDREIERKEFLQVGSIFLKLLPELACNFGLDQLHLGDTIMTDVITSHEATSETCYYGQT